MTNRQVFSKKIMSSFFKNDNIVIYKSSDKKEEEFKLPTQYIYSKKNLTSEEQKQWDANKK